MRIVTLSDTHLRHHDITVPDGDILIHAGDFSNRGNWWDLREFSAWFLALPHPYKVFVPGNHDIVCERERSGIVRSLFDCANVVVPLHEPFELAGLKFFGSPYSSEIYPHSPWVFTYEKESDRARCLWEAVPDGTDILVTHGPPYGILDEVQNIIGNEDRHVGDKFLRERVFQVKPKLHVFGHIHESSGQEWNMEINTTFFNAAICDLSYRPVNPVRVYDYKE